MGATWSDLEADFRAMLKPTGLPMPQVNQFIVLDDGEPAIRADFYRQIKRDAEKMAAVIVRPLAPGP